MIAMRLALPCAVRLAAVAALAAAPLSALGFPVTAPSPPASSWTQDTPTAPFAGRLPTPTPDDTLTLDEALTRAFEASPRLRAAELEVEAHHALSGQAGRLPNPVFDAEAENVASSGPEEAVLTAGLDQLVELGGDRAARRRLADREAERAATDLVVARLDLAALTRVRYAEAAAAQARLHLAQAAAALALAVLAATREQVDVGDRSPVDQTRAEVARAGAEAEAGQAEAGRQAALARLAALWADVPDFDAVTPLAPPQPVPTLPTLAKRLGVSATLAVWDAEAERRAAALRLEEARRIPDLTLSAGYRRFTASGDGAFVGGLSVPLPVFDRNGGAIAAARARLQAVQAEREGAVVEARAALAAAHSALVAAFAEAEALQSEVLPLAEDVAIRIEEGYQEGKFTLLDVLDAQRTLAEARVRYAEALAAYHTAAADVERLTAPPTVPTE